MTYLQEGKSETIAHIAIGFLMAHLHSLSGQPDAAAHVLQTLKQSAEAAANPLVLHHCILCEAEIALNRGEIEIAVASLGEALALGRNLSISYFFPWHPSALARLCAVALEHEIETAAVQRIIRERGLPCGPEARHLESWPRPLRVYTLGDFAILRHGERLSFNGRAPRKPLDLLQALIAFGGSGVRIERLMDALWPDADGDAAHMAFDTTLHRMRKLLGVESVLVLAEGRLTLSPELCWVDALAVKDLIARGQRALAAPASLGAEAIERIAAKLSELVSAGGFLEGTSDEPWVEPARSQIARGAARILDPATGPEPDGPARSLARR